MKTGIALGLSALLLLFCFHTHAFLVEPMVLMYQEQGQQANGAYRVQNTSEQPLAVEVVIMERQVDAQNNETLVPADDDFIVMPMQALIEPGQYQQFRSRYLGDVNLDNSKSYRIIFQQLPIENEEQQSGIDLLFNFETLAFVNPLQGEQNLEVSVVQNKLKITNSGNIAADLNEFKVNFATANGDKAVSWSKIGPYSEANYLLPQQGVSIPIQDDWQVSGASSASLEYVGQ